MIPDVVEIDIFKLTKFGSLKLKERKWFNERQIESAKAALQLATIAQSLALQFEIDPLEALNIVSNPQQGDIRLLPYAEELGQVPDQLRREMGGTGEAITMFLKSRLPADFLERNSQALLQQYEIVVSPGDVWVQEFTDELPETTIEKLVEFMNGETTRWAAPTEPEADSLGNESDGGENRSTPITPSTVTVATGASS